MFLYHNLSSTRLYYSFLLIATIGFDCTNHMDFIDEVHSVKVPITNDLDAIFASKHITGSHRPSTTNAQSFVECFDMSLPTTCCYQIVLSIKDFVFIQFFFLPSLRLCFQIKTCWSHCFMVEIFSHSTSKSIFICEGKDYVGKFHGGLFLPRERVEVNE